MVLKYLFKDLMFPSEKGAWQPVYVTGAQNEAKSRPCRNNRTLIFSDNFCVCIYSLESYVTKYKA